jgi:osmotically-inducible protein OsmY
MKTDAQLKQDVVDELKWDPAVDQTKIGVAVTEGAATLSGYVSNYAEKVAAKAAARRVDGVHAVVDKIDVQVASRHRASDEGLAERISHVLTWNVSASGKSIKAEVKNGIVTLIGEVDWHYQRANVLQNIEHVAGVIGVIDLVKIRPRASAGDVQEWISAALKRHADIEASRVSVTIANGTVTLSGEVESLAEMDRVERAAWAAPGIIEVVDNLRVKR